MLDVVADDVSVATDAAVPRSPDTKAALKYLEASGANAISITTGPGGTVIAVGYKADAVAVHWLPAASARAVAARARKLAGDADEVEAVVAALKEAAVQCQVRLIEHSVAMGRAANAAERLDAFIDQLKTSGIWLDFTKSSGNGGSRPRRAAKGSCHSRRIERAESGERLSVKDVKKLIDEDSSKQETEIKELLAIREARIRAEYVISGSRKPPPEPENPRQYWLQFSRTKHHPVTECVRLMTTEEFAGLVKSIKRDGLLDPIILVEHEGEDVILDGVCREIACVIAGVEPRYKKI